MPNRTTFISELASRILEENDHLDQVTVVFPNRRAGLFFRKALSEHITKPIWMPKVTSMEDFVVQYSPYTKVESLEAIFMLYEEYREHQKRDETFDQFFFWGEMILRDFEEIDHYLVNTRQLFTSIKSQKELDEEFYFLEEEDRAIIQSFWSSFLPQATRYQEAFLQTWKLLLPIYEALRQRLLNQGKAYGGLIYRELCDQLDQLVVEPGKKIYFAGFNALTLTEERIIKHFVEHHKASVIWDVDEYYFSDSKQEAGLFFRAYHKDPILGKTFPKESPNRFQTTKVFTATGVSLEVGQTKALAEVLDRMSDEIRNHPEETVVVLPQEHMLFPTLHAIPDSLDKVNITMGYPLKDTPVYSLLENVLLLQNHRKESLVHGVSFYFKQVMELLEHPLLFSLDERKIRDLLMKIRKQNLIVLYKEDLDLSHPLLTFIFEKATHPLQYLEHVLKGLYDAWKDRGHDLELEFIARFHAHVKQLNTMIGEKAEGLSYDFLIKLFRRLARSFKIPFTGEPLNGMQIMGILETRNLDFKKVFILSMNEDSWPATPRRGSFIPYNIRKAFDLPVFEHQDAIYSYLFYRLLQRAEEVHFYYNIVLEFNVNGELSRLVQQLEAESGYTIEKRILASPIQVKVPEPITIEKSKEVLAKLDRFTLGYPGKDASTLSPSALNAYLDCRLRFYFKYVEKLYEPDEVKEELDAAFFGTLLHDTMEKLYENFKAHWKREVVYEEDIFWIREGVSGALNQAFIKRYGITNEKKFKLEGRSLIAAEIIKKFINKILDYDKRYAPFRILGLEAGNKDGFGLSFPVQIGDTSRHIRLKGVIDRIDMKGGIVRVIDYKTGRDAKDFTTVASLTDRDDKNRNKTVFQVFYYSYLFFKKGTETYQFIEPGVFNSKDLFDEKFEWLVYDKESKTPIRDFTRYVGDFEAGLASLLSEMYNSEVPFDQTTNDEKCKYCSYKDICGR